MSNKDKIAKLEKDLAMATRMLDHMGSMIVPAIEALKYIAQFEEEEESKIILLKNVGVPEPAKQTKQASEEVAGECLMLVMELQKNFSATIEEDEPASHLSVVKGPEEVRLTDGDEIAFTTDFDILYHKCCGCGLLHEVSLDWCHEARNTVLRTYWTQKDSLPSEADVTEAGHTVIRRGGKF